ncbi:MAG: 50S ribosomal protein L29 [Pseudomonadota bacterium]|jgi:large subunit ribosomal protein L29|nr:50S ribosomal protein L29 [Pseudomonadota bacterium]MDP1904432.1 50S ribosomal protein L29 [Pseudomonadota bacterium]MDP2351364.1 50S ribosomal protein L29 [Pseudomonadota bacterium]
MNAKELKAKSTVELKQEIKDLLRAQFSLRMQLSTQQTNKSHELRKTRRDIARVRTVMWEQKLSAGN